MIDKAKDAALKKGRELGGEAINRATKRVESEAGKRGYDISSLTQKGVERAHSAPHDAEGHAEKLLNRAQSKIEKKAGLSGDGLYQAGNGMLLHVLGHIDPNHVIFTIEQAFGQGLGKLSLAHSRRS